MSYGFGCFSVTVGKACFNCQVKVSVVEFIYVWLKEA